MRRFPIVAFVASLLTLAIPGQLISSGEPVKQADSVKAIKQVVMSFYDNLSQG